MEQMREKERQKEAEVRRKTELEEEDDERIKRDNAILEKRKNDEDQRLKMRQAQKNA